MLNCGGTAQTVHYDGNGLLFVSDASGNFVSADIEMYGMMAPSGSVTVNDRDYAGLVVMTHGPQWYTTWDPTQTIARYKNAQQVGTTMQGQGPLLRTLYNYTRTEGFETPFGVVQGARAADQDGWTTPDAYAGDIHDPMSQKPYLWNRNNPYTYSDPSGYEPFQSTPSPEARPPINPAVYERLRDTWRYGSPIREQEQRFADQAALQAAEFAGLQDPRKARSSTIGVTLTLEGVRIVTTSDGGVLRPEIRNALRKGGWDVFQTQGVQGVHAEVKGVLLAEKFGLHPIAVGASRDVCSECRAFLEAHGVSAYSPIPRH